jgi:hypothetical protein
VRGRGGGESPLLSLHFTSLFGILTGKNYIGCKILLMKSGSRDFTAWTVKAVSSGKITYLFSHPAGTEKGKWDIFVKNPDGKYDYLHNTEGREYPHIHPRNTSRIPMSGGL